LVLLLAWETLFPVTGPLPVTSHTRAMEHSDIVKTAVTGGTAGPVLASASPRQKGGGNPGRTFRRGRPRHLRASRQSPQL
jgi:hypothetical protein